MKTEILTIPAAFIVLSLASCENPADKTAAAEVKDAVEKSTEEAPAAATAAAVKYAFTPESKVEFTGSKVTGKHDGGFKTFTGYFTVGGGKLVGNDHKVVIDMTSTWSDSDRLTGHLKNPDFFDVEKFPESTFELTSIEAGEDGAYTVAGNFTLRGVTKNISFPATVTESTDAAAIKAEFNINRKDFGIVYTGMADDLIRDQVIIRLDLTAKPDA